MKAFHLASILTICLVGSAPTALVADDHGNDKPYLALGDSVTFGFLPSLQRTPFEYVNSANFIGYPDYLGPAVRLMPVNAACPGETSGSFLSSTAPDNGCRAFRANFPLHVAYRGTQADFASAFLQANPKTQLVTLQIGANDLFILQAQCAKDFPADPFACIFAGLQATLSQLGQNVLTAIAGIRAAGFRRTIVVLTYYPLGTDSQTTTVIHALNDTLIAAAAQGDAMVVDTFAPFTDASRPTGNPCLAGLLKNGTVTPTTCDVHPSQSGQRLIAGAVAAVLSRSRHEN